MMTVLESGEAPEVESQKLQPGRLRRQIDADGPGIEQDAGRSLEPARVGRGEASTRARKGTRGPEPAKDPLAVPLKV